MHTKMYKTRILACAAILPLFLAATIATRPKPQVEPVTFDTIINRSRCGIEGRKNVVITNFDDWQHLWNKLFIPQSLPDIDFKRQMVIGVFAGLHGDSTYSTTVTQILREGKRLRVFIEESYNGPTCPPGPPITSQPCHLIVTEKIKKADRRVLFEEPVVTPKVCT